MASVTQSDVEPGLNDVIKRQCSKSHTTMDFEKMFLSSDVAKDRRRIALSALSFAKDSNEHHMDDALKFLFLLDAMYKTDPLVMKIKEVLAKLNKRDQCKYMVVPNDFAIGLDERGFFGLSSHNNKIVREKVKSKHVLKVNSPEGDFIEIDHTPVEGIVDRFENSLAKLSQNIEQSVLSVPAGRYRVMLRSFTDSTVVTVAKASIIWMMLHGSYGVTRSLKKRNPAS